MVWASDFSRIIPSRVSVTLTKHVRKHFEFLIHDFGFALKSDGDSVRYDSATLYVEIGSGKGETDLIVVLKVDTDTIRPYVSHLFSLTEIVRYYKTGPFPTLESFPLIAGISEEERVVIYLATLTKKYCGEILRGDITPLEMLSACRRGL